MTDAVYKSNSSEILAAGIQKGECYINGLDKIKAGLTWVNKKMTS